MRTVSCILFALLLGACATPVTSPTYYLLRPSGELSSGPLALSDRYTLGDISVAPYINQPGLLLETSAGQVRPAGLHLWAEPVEAGIGTFLLQEISRLHGRDLMVGVKDLERITIRIDQMHGTQAGDALLVAYWWIDASSTNTVARRFARSQPLAQDGYAALAAAQRALLEQLAADIADHLQNP